MALTKIQAALLSDNAVTTASIVDGTIVLADISNGAVSSSKLSNTGVNAAVYGGSSQIPVITVDAAGRLTAAANATPSIANTQITGLITSAQIAGVANTQITGNIIASQITSVANTQVTGIQTVAQGGTGLGTLTANAVILGNGTGSVTQVSPGTSGNVLVSDGTTWKSTAVASGLSFTVKSSDYTAAGGDNLLVDTSGGSVTITLPSGPSTGSLIYLQDSKGTFNTNALKVYANGATIMGNSSNLYVNTTNIGFGLLYNGSDWRLY